MTTLFDTVAPPTPSPERPRFALRPYQVEAIDSFAAHVVDGAKRMLLVLPTGCGKTEVFAQIIARFSRRRALVLVHRTELAEQAARRIRERAGRNVAIEQAGAWAQRHGDNDVVVGMIQTLVSTRQGEKRMERFTAEHFDLVIVDEAHHATAASYRQVFEHFEHDGSLILGVTATPDRADEQALGQVFDTVIYDYEIRQAVADGWLVMPRQTYVSLGDEYDLSGIKTVAGDLHKGQTAELCEKDKIVAAMASSLHELAKGRKSLVFCQSVAQAEAMAALLNEYVAGDAAWVSGETPDHERNAIFRAFGTGRLQYLVNVGVATEGWDDPSVERPVSVIGMCRPTKSRSLFAQMVGRGTRPVPGLVDRFGTPLERRNAIAASVKPYVEVIDYVGNAGKHSLACVTDLMAGDMEPKAVEELKREVQKKAGRGSKAVDVLELAHEIEERRRIAIENQRKRQERFRGVKVQAWYTTQEIDPFDAFGIHPVRERAWHHGKELSDKQRAILTARNIDPDKYDYGNAKKLIDTIMQRGVPTAKQAKLLSQYGWMGPEITYANAGRLIGALKDNGWRSNGLDRDAILAEGAA